MTAVNELKQTDSLSLVRPTPEHILGAILFGIIGWMVFRRGRKTAVPVLTWSGLALMLYSYGVSQTWLLWLLWLLGVALSGLVFAKRD